MAAVITVVGAGIIGLWQALTLSRNGYRTRLVERSATPFAGSASRHAGAMLAPDCEAESAPKLVRDLGREGYALWRNIYKGVVTKGTLVVAASRDRAELWRFGAMTTGHRTLTEAELAHLEPDLARRFATSLLFEDEAHVATPDALDSLLAAVREAGCETTFGEPLDEDPSDGLVIDCRGMAARADLPNLRGVRGERLLVASGEIELTRPVRLLHPRHPIYIVPWGGGRYLIGATMIESEDDGPITVKSTLELLGAAYAFHPAFGEAQVIETGAAVRPAFPDNVPRVVVRRIGRRIFVNGAYRHGFLLAPVLAKAVTNFIGDGTDHPLIVKD